MGLVAVVVVAVVAVVTILSSESLTFHAKEHNAWVQITKNKLDSRKHNKPKWIGVSAVDSVARVESTSIASNHRSEIMRMNSHRRQRLFSSCAWDKNRRHFFPFNRLKPIVAMNPSSQDSNVHDQVRQLWVWEEEDPEQTSLMTLLPSSFSSPTTQSKFWFPWRVTRKNHREDSDADSSFSPATAIEVSTHPLRNTNWTITVRWRDRSMRNALHARFGNGNIMPLQFEFSERGYVRLLSTFNNEDNNNQHIDNSNDNSDTTRNVYVGTWDLNTRGGFSWTIALENMAAMKASSNNQSAHTFHGDFHVNTYAPYARVTRGVVLRHHSAPASHSQSKVPWFRPVVATFYGTGNG
jgi:hypothetical protein